VDNSKDVFLEFMQFGLGGGMNAQGSEHIRNPMLPADSMEQLIKIDQIIKPMGINVDGFILEANLWDVKRYTDYHSSMPWDDYTKEWAAHATEMIQLVERLYPQAKHMWLSTCIAPNVIDKVINKDYSQLLNEVARTIVPDSWTYIDVESLLGKDLHYRQEGLTIDPHHFAPDTAVKLVDNIMELLAEASASTSAKAPEATASTSAKAPEATTSTSAKAPEATASTSAKAPEANASSSAKAPDANASSSVQVTFDSIAEIIMQETPDSIGEGHSREETTRIMQEAAIRGPGGGSSWAWGLAVAAPAALGAAAVLGGAAVAFRRWGASLAPARAHLFRPLDGS
jgi:hypothetical protein